MFDNALQFRPGFQFLEREKLEGSLDLDNILIVTIDEQRDFNFIESKPIETSKGLFRIFFGSDITYDDNDTITVEKLSYRIVPIKLNSPKEFQKNFFDKWYDGIVEKKIHEIFMKYLHVEA